MSNLAMNVSNGLPEMKHREVDPSSPYPPVKVPEADAEFLPPDRLLDTSTCLKAARRRPTSFRCDLEEALLSLRRPA